MLLEDARADRKPQLLDGRVLLPARHAVHEVLDGLARQEARGIPVRERGAEVPFEAQRDRQVLGIVPVPAPHHAEHAQA